MKKLDTKKVVVWVLISGMTLSAFACVFAALV